MHTLQCTNYKLWGSLTVVAAAEVITYSCVPLIAGASTGAIELSRIKDSNEGALDSCSLRARVEGGLIGSSNASNFGGESSDTIMIGPASIAMRTMFSTEAWSLCNACPSHHSKLCPLRLLACLNWFTLASGKQWMEMNFKGEHLLKSVPTRPGKLSHYHRPFGAFLRHDCTLAPLFTTNILHCPPNYGQGVDVLIFARSMPPKRGPLRHNRRAMKNFCL